MASHFWLRCVHSTHTSAAATTIDSSCSAASASDGVRVRNTAEMEDSPRQANTEGAVT